MCASERLAVVGFSDGLMLIWDCTSHKIVYTNKLLLHSRSVHSLAIVAPTQLVCLSGDVLSLHSFPRATELAQLSPVLEYCHS